MRRCLSSFVLACLAFAPCRAASPEWLGESAFRGWVDYSSAGGFGVKAWLSRPAGKPPFKLFVYVGGGGKGGDIAGQVDSLLRLHRLEAFQEAGYAILCPAYRGAKNFGPEYEAAFDYGGKEVEDIVCGARFLIEQKLADRRHVFFSGVSHGAKISMMIAERYRIATAVAPISGDYDTSSVLAGIRVPGYANALQAPKRPPVIRDSIRKSHPEFSEEEILREAARRDPMRHVDQVDCPIFLIASEEDIIVGHYVAARMKQELTRLHKTFVDKMYRGKGTVHALPTQDVPAAELWADLFRFCERKPLSGTGTIPIAALENHVIQ